MRLQLIWMVDYIFTTSIAAPLRQCAHSNGITPTSRYIPMVLLYTLITKILNFCCLGSFYRTTCSLPHRYFGCKKTKVLRLLAFSEFHFSRTRKPSNDLLSQTKFSHLNCTTLSCHGSRPCKNDCDQIHRLDSLNRNKPGRWTQKSPTGDTNEQAKQTQDTPGPQNSQPSVPKQEDTKRLYFEFEGAFARRGVHDRNRSQPFATVRNRPQVFARSPYGRAYGKFCRGGSFWGLQTCRCFVLRGRRGTS